MTNGAKSVQRPGNPATARLRPASEPVAAGGGIVEIPAMFDKRGAGLVPTEFGHFDGHGPTPAQHDCAAAQPTPVIGLRKRAAGLVATVVDMPAMGAFADIGGQCLRIGGRLPQYKARAFPPRRSGKRTTLPETGSHDEGSSSNAKRPPSQKPRNRLKSNLLQRPHAYAFDKRSRRAETTSIRCPDAAANLREFLTFLKIALARNRPPAITAILICCRMEQPGSSSGS